jgi:hypothetical protein
MVMLVLVLVFLCRIYAPHKQPASERATAKAKGGSFIISLPSTIKNVKSTASTLTADS